MSTGALWNEDWTPRYDIGFDLQYSISEEDDSEWAGLLLNFSVDYLKSADENPSIADLVSDLSITVYEGEIPDNRAEWHHNYTTPKRWMKAHIYRLAMGWQETKLAEELNENPDLADEFGFFDEDWEPDPPKQSQLWNVYHEKWPDVTRELCEGVAEEIVTEARDAGLAVPDRAFQPEDRDAESKRSERRLTEKKTREVWQQAKPIVTDTFYLDRADNARVPEGSFWEAQALAGSRQDTFTENGVDRFRTATTRPPEQWHTGRSHRHQLQKHSEESVREMLRETTRRLVQKARRNGELQGKLWAAIDTTKGTPWSGDIEWTEGKNRPVPEDDHLLGYKHEEGETIDYHFQWATIQIVGLDVPLVLDAVPRERGETKADIVEDLLEGAHEVIPDIELVMMDREFDSEGVKNVCDQYGVYYLNPARKQSSERVMCSRLRRAGKRVHVERQETLSGPDRYRMYLPARNSDVFEPVEGDADDAEEPSEEEQRNEVRQELVEDFVEVTGGEPADAGDDAWYDEMVEKIREDEEELPGSEEDANAYALFETNHPAFQPDLDADEDQRLATVQAFVSRYSNRWGIENGYKKIKQFRCRTTSKDYEYRYFCFAFACVLYNVWRLVDLLVKMAFEDDPDYSPRVSSGQFLELTPQHFGLDPPD